MASSTANTVNVNRPAISRQSKEFVWTDDEVELLLGVVNDYKAEKAGEAVDWESVKSKYSDILSLFVSHLPKEGEETVKDFPHKREQISQKTVTSKIKAIRTKFRQAVDSGRKSGHGRVVLLFYELCSKIWGGSPATEQLERGVESSSVQSESTSDDTQLQSQMNASTEDSTTEQTTCEEGSMIQQRRQLLDGKLSQYRQEKLKRKLPIDAQILGCAKEDLEVKRKLIKTMEDMDKQYSDNMASMSKNMERLADSISEGFVALKTFLTAQQPSTPYSSSPYSYLPPFPGPSTSGVWPPTPHDE